MKHSAALRRHRPCVLLIFPTSIAMCRTMLRGILDYVHQEGPWQLHILEDREGEQKIKNLHGWGATGIIAYVNNAEHARLVRTARVPTVMVDPLKTFLRPTDPLSQISHISCDSADVGRAAGEYLLRHHFQNFGFVGEINGIHWSTDRCASFVQTLHKAGAVCHVYPTPTVSERRDAGLEEERLCTWLRALPKPAALLVAWDVRGRQVLGACAKIGMEVPRDIAVLSVDNDTLLCETSNPPLSSIQMAQTQAGYRAAKLLDELMRHPHHQKKPTVMTYSVERIVSRRSTESFCVSDPAIARALEFASLNLAQPIGVREIAEHLHLSQRLLELRAKRTFGHSFCQELQSMRLGHAVLLLHDTSLSIGDIAAASGFSNQSHFTHAFQKQYHTPPSKIRSALHP